MIVYMNIQDPSWMDGYFRDVPELLAEYGAESVAGGRTVRRLEGDMAVPDRIAVFSFPSLDAVDRFMADDRYRSHRERRERGAESQIFVFENAVSEGGLV